MTAHSQKCPLLARTQARTRALHSSVCAINRTVHVEGRAKCPTVPQRREIVTGTRAARQGSK